MEKMTDHKDTQEALIMQEFYSLIAKIVEEFNRNTSYIISELDACASNQAELANVAGKYASALMSQYTNLVKKHAKILAQYPLECRAHINRAIESAKNIGLRVDIFMAIHLKMEELRERNIAKKNAEEQLMQPTKTVENEPSVDEKKKKRNKNITRDAALEESILLNIKSNSIH